MRNRVPLLLLAMVVAAPATSAQVVVHPNRYISIEGAGNNWYPFRYNTSAGHYQQSHEASQFPGQILITEISFRYKDDRVLPAATASFKMTLAHCANAWNALSPTFANNIGVGATTVFDGTWSIPAFSGDPATPNPFTAHLALTTPFLYDPTRGDLIMDVEVRQSTAPGSTGAFAISYANVGVNRVVADTGNPLELTGTVSTSGLIAEFSGPPCSGSVVYAGQGCPDSSQTILSQYYLGCPDLGSNLTIGTRTGTSVTAPVFLIMGVSDQFWLGIVLPLDLTPFGAPGCSVYASQEVMIGPLANPGGGASFQTTIPQNSNLLQAVMYWQGYILEPGINLLNIASSNYQSMTIG